MTCLFVGFWRFALRIGYWIPTWGHLSLANVGRSSSAGALALFHCIWAIRKVCYIHRFPSLFLWGKPNLHKSPPRPRLSFFGRCLGNSWFETGKTPWKTGVVLSQVTGHWHFDLHFALTTWRAWQEVLTSGVQTRHFPTSSDEGWQREAEGFQKKC